MGITPDASRRALLASTGYRHVGMSQEGSCILRTQEGILLHPLSEAGTRGVKLD